jgi:LuxR family transcriptional regulator, maltose regulon positive regulatory protein
MYITFRNPEFCGVLYNNSMSVPVLTTKLFIPSARPDLVSRPRLIECLNEGLQRKLTLISAPAGFGKTTLLSEWIAACDLPVAWISLDEGDNDPTRILDTLISALQTIPIQIGDGILAMLRASQTQPLPTEPILTALLNEISKTPMNFMVVLDDYHVLDSKSVDAAFSFMLDHLPPQMHLVIATREDPQLPLPRLRARGQLTELRTSDLRFSPAEVSEFLNRVMGLNLLQEDVAALEARTEGWIAGLQLAALSMKGHKDTSGFIKSFTGSHHFVLDYLLEEVLQQQTESVQNFLLSTSILERLSGPLCEALLDAPALSGQETLEYLERANLFIIPLDHERCWYRYHHLFADLLRQRLHQNTAVHKDAEADLHRRASQWYEDNGLDVDALHHAAAAHDIERAERLIEGKGMPLYFRGAMLPVICWLESLPKTVLDARPSLWVKYLTALLFSGYPSIVEQKLSAVDTALQNAAADDNTRDLEGQVAAIRALLASAQNQTELIISCSQRALELLHPDNLPARTITTYSRGYAYLLQGDRQAASRAFTEVISIGQNTGNIMLIAAAGSALGNLQETDNLLHPAAETYHLILKIVNDPAHMANSEAHIGLARINYEWNDLELAEQHGRQCVQVAPLIECDTPVICEILLARVKLAQGDLAGAAAMLAQADQFARQHNFAQQIPEVAAAQVQVLLRQGNLAAAAHLAQAHNLPVSQARVLIAQGKTSAAFKLLKKVEEGNFANERLKLMVFQALVYHVNDDAEKALHLLEQALTLAEPGGFVRLFLDEGAPMAQLIALLAEDGILPGYTSKLLAAFNAEKRPDFSCVCPPIEPLSQRELEVLRLIAQGLSNREISERLFLALDTVKGHNRRLFDKLQVQRRTEAIARARELKLL